MLLDATLLVGLNENVTVEGKDDDWTGSAVAAELLALPLFERLGGNADELAAALDEGV